MARGRKQVGAVLCGDLNLLRCLTAGGVSTLVVSPDPGDVVFRSRHCGEKRVIASPLADPAKTVDQLVRLGRELAGRPVLYYGDDAMLLLLSRNRERLAPYYRFLMPAPERVEQLVNKNRFASFAEEHQLPVPRTLTSGEAGSAKRVSERLQMPCVVKPSVHIGWDRSQIACEKTGEPQKALRAHSLEELDRLMERVSRFTDDFLIQEYVPGDDACLYSYHAYLDRASNVLAHYSGRKIRTYRKELGVSTYLELVKEPEIARLGNEIVTRLKHVGPVKIDFKQDPRSGRFYLLEINPRFNLWHYLGTACGVNLPLIAYKDLTGETASLSSTYKTGVRWLSLGNDLRAFIRDYHPDGDLSWASWLLSLRGSKVYDVFSWSDPIPFLVYALNYWRGYCKRTVRSFAK